VTSIFSIDGKELYSGKEETMREALRNAIDSGTDLRNADLRNAYLVKLDLSGVDLSGANLSRANLRGVNLSGANLIGAKLSGADFRFSTGLQITGVAKSMEQYYTIVLVGDSLFIGCRHHKLHEWFSFDDETIDKMASGALKWWRENKSMLHAWSNAKDFGIEL
jgi:hypothetical protein